MELPKSEIVESGYLNSMFQKRSSSYKFFWLKGIITEVLEGNREITYKRLVARMMAAAWYPVIYYKLSLGHSDKLAEAIAYVHQHLGIKRDEKQDVIVSVICESHDKTLLKWIGHFTNLVPFRLISLFYQREIEYERKHDPSFYDGKINNIIEKYNRNDQNHALYIMDRANGRLHVSADWAQYLKLNAPVVEGWLNYKLVEYIQLRNRNVPSIPFKIFPPEKRNLSQASRYWKLVDQKIHLPELYTGLRFTEENKKKHGIMSIDHFIPWSFVLHDELWNLCPMFKNINSKKGNKLADERRYLAGFCEYQYQAFQVARDIKGIGKNALDQYLNVNKDVHRLGKDDRGHETFVASMRQTIEPLYQIANHQGYGIWWYDPVDRLR